MREDSIFKNLEAGQNRFVLCHQAFKAVRMLHNPGNRIQDTTNDALHRLADIVPEAAPANVGAINSAPEQVVIGPLIETEPVDGSHLSIRANM